MRPIHILITVSFVLVSGTGTYQAKNYNQKEKIMATDSTKQYGFNRDFLKKHTTILELRNGNSAITLAPSWQARVMTSTAEGDKGYSFGEKDCQIS